MQNKAEFIRHATMHIGAGDWNGSNIQAVEYAERLYKALADKGYGFPEATTSPPGPRAVEEPCPETVECPGCRGAGGKIILNGTKYMRCRDCNGKGKSQHHRGGPNGESNFP